jgi:hypothetical protein
MATGQDVMVGAWYPQAHAGEYSRAGLTMPENLLDKCQPQWKWVITHA